MGRPPKELNAEQVFKLARIGCTLDEIGDILGCSGQTVSRRFGEELARARGDFKSSLRRAQYMRAVKDRSDSMLIHLGKHWLKQGTHEGADDFTPDGPAVDDAGNAVEP